MFEAQRKLQGKDKEQHYIEILAEILWYLIGGDSCSRQSE